MQVIPPLMCSLVDPLLKPKETQPDSIQPHCAVPAQLTVPELIVEASCMLVIAIGEGCGLCPLHICSKISLCAVKI